MSTVSPTVRLLSFDLGPVNLGSAQVDIETAARDYQQFVIRTWDRYTVSNSKCSIPETVCHLLDEFKVRYPTWPAGVHHVLIEKQVPNNPRAVVMSYALFTYFLCLWNERSNPAAVGPGANWDVALRAQDRPSDLSQAVQFVDPYKKNQLAKTFPTGVLRSDYASRTKYNKKLVTEACKQLLVNRPSDMQRLLSSKSKMDDMADSLFQALAFYDELINQRAPEVPAALAVAFSSRKELQFPKAKAKTKARPSTSAPAAGGKSKGKRKTLAVVEADDDNGTGADGMTGASGTSGRKRKRPSATGKQQKKKPPSVDDMPGLPIER